MHVAGMSHAQHDWHAYTMHACHHYCNMHVTLHMYNYCSMHVNAFNMHERYTMHVHNICMHHTCTKHANYMQVPLVLHACTLHMHNTGSVQVCTMHVCQYMHVRYCKHSCYMHNILSRADLPGWFPSLACTQYL